MKLKKPKMEKKGKDDDETYETDSYKISKGETRIGLQKGVTVNMGDFNSARVSLWMERVVEDNKQEVKRNLEDMNGFLDKWLQSEVDAIKRDNE